MTPILGIPIGKLGGLQTAVKAATSTRIPPVADVVPLNMTDKRLRTWRYQTSKETISLAVNGYLHSGHSTDI